MVTEQGREVFGFHLHRYLANWLRETGCRSVMVILGFDGSAADLGAYRIDLSRAQPVQAGWTFSDLEDAWRFGNGRLLWEHPDGSSLGFDVVPILDHQDEDGQGGCDVLGFVTVSEDEALTAEEIRHFSEQAAEAIRVARRNGVRLFFDELGDLPVKSLLYATMARLPEWIGCDHSAAVVVTHDLDAVTLEDTLGGEFSVLAERLFVGDGTEELRRRDRLVGMAITAGDDETTLLADALRRHREDPGRRLLMYCRDDDEATWRAAGDDRELKGWHELADRARAGSLVLVPLVHQSRGDRDLLGFLAISWQARFRLPPSAPAIFEELADDLARLLRRSPLYTLSVRKMWVVNQVQHLVEEAIRGADADEAPLQDLIGKVSQLVADYVDIPSFAIGYLVSDEKPRTMRYVHAHGWSRFDRLDLQVDVAQEEEVDSGISALALRLERPVVLAGGYGEGEAQSFKNYLWVDEQRGQLVDARTIEAGSDVLASRGRPLREYYKPARETAYATLAYPMSFAGRVMGVLTVEVERHTDWLWWTGFGGHLFWEMIAREVAMGIYWLRNQAE